MDVAKIDGLFAVQTTRIGQVQRAGSSVVSDICRKNFERWRDA